MHCHGPGGATVLISNALTPPGLQHSTPGPAPPPVSVVEVASSVTFDTNLATVQVQIPRAPRINMQHWVCCKLV